MNIELLDTSAFEDFDHHEKVVSCMDSESGLHAIIAIHDRTLGPALGGLRMWPYPTTSAAIKDVLRLSRGMTYKSAVAGLPLGGGKAVIIGDPHTNKSPALLRAMGQFVESLDGHYVTAEDSGTSVADLAVIGTQTRHVAGIHERRLSDGSIASGDPSPSTALGVFIGLSTAAKNAFGTSSLAGCRVAIQGVGNVGRHLARLLADAGAELTIADVNPEHIDLALTHVSARVVDSAGILAEDVDIIAPCAMGGILTADILPSIKARVIAGAANNQLADAAAGLLLYRRGLLYAPDYVINAGGIIDIFYERDGYDHGKVIRHIGRIGKTLDEIFRLSRDQGQPTHVMADRLALRRLMTREIGAVA